MFVRKSITLLLLISLGLGIAGTAVAQQGGTLTPAQRLDLLRSQLDSLRTQLNSALASLPKADKDESKDSARSRLAGLEKEVKATISEVNSLRAKVDRAERFDTEDLTKIEAAQPDLTSRVDAGLRDTASARVGTASDTPKKKKKKGKFLGIFGGGSDAEEYEDLTGSVVAGRDRVLFEEGTKQVRKGHLDVARLLYNTIITAYPDSNYLPFAKLAIADTFYLEGTTSALIQAGAAYQDWLTFFPTDTLAERVMLKVAESEMRQMNIPGLDSTHSRKAEQRLKVLLQNYPQTTLRPDVDMRLREVQENLAMNNKAIGDQYYLKSQRGGGGLKGAQWRYRFIIDNYPNFSQLDEVLFREAVTYMQEEETDEAAKYFQRIVRDYPNGDYYEKAVEQLKIIGAAIPEPSEEGKARPALEKDGITGRIMKEVFGFQPLSVDKNGVLIWRDLEEGQKDPIDVAVENQGQLPDNRMPTAPRTRRTVPPTQSTTVTPVSTNP
ncbi:MAG: outer membrane protein assembly factor BamD [Pyrinomonadaceae bacterium]